MCKYFSVQVESRIPAIFDDSCFMFTCSLFPIVNHAQINQVHCIHVLCAYERKEVKINRKKNTKVVYSREIVQVDIKIFLCIWQENSTYFVRHSFAFTCRFSLLQHLLMENVEYSPLS